MQHAICPFAAPSLTGIGVCACSRVVVAETARRKGSQAAQAWPRCSPALWRWGGLPGAMSQGPFPILCGQDKRGHTGLTRLQDGPQWIRLEGRDWRQSGVWAAADVVVIILAFAQGATNSADCSLASLTFQGNVQSEDGPSRGS